MSKDANRFKLNKNKTCNLKPTSQLIKWPLNSLDPTHPASQRSLFCVQLQIDFIDF